MFFRWVLHVNQVWIREESMIHWYTDIPLSVTNVRACFGSEQKLPKPSQTLRWKVKHAWRKWKVLIPLPTFCLLSAGCQDWSVWDICQRWKLRCSSPTFRWKLHDCGEYQIRNERHTAVVNRKTRHENSAWKSHGAHALRFPTTKALAILFHVNELKDTFDDEFPIKALDVWIIVYKDFAMLLRWFQGLLLEVLLELQIVWTPNQLIFGYRSFLSCHHQPLCISGCLLSRIAQLFFWGLPCLFSHS